MPICLVIGDILLIIWLNWCLFGYSTVRLSQWFLHLINTLSNIFENMDIFFLLRPLPTQNNLDSSFICSLRMLRVTVIMAMFLVWL